MKRLLVFILMFVMTSGFVVEKSYGVVSVKTLEGHPDCITSVAFDSDGKILASAGGNIIIIWDATTGNKKRSITGYDIDIVAFSPDGKMLALSSGGMDAPIALLDVATGDKIKTFTRTSNFSVKSIAFSPDGKLLAAGAWSGDIMLWDVKTGNMIKRLNGHTYSVNSITFSPDGKLLASGGWGSEQIILWDVETGGKKRILNGHSNPIDSVTFNTNGNLLASGSNRIINLWDISTGSKIKTLEGSTIYVGNSISFSKDNRLLVSGS